MKKKILPVILIVAALSIIGYFVYDYVSNRLSENPDIIEASGVIEASTVTLSSPTAGRLSEAAAGEGDSVKQEEVVASMDSSLLESQMQVILANVEAAQAQIDAALLGQDQAIDQAELALELAESIKEEMLTYNHYIYYDQPISITDTEGHSSSSMSMGISDSQVAAMLGDDIDSSTSGSSTSTSTSYAGLSQKQIVRAQLQDALNQYQAALLRLEQASENDTAVKLAEANVKISEAQLDLNLQQMSELDIISPIDGIILGKFAEQGEYLLPGSPVYEIGDLTEVTCDIYIPEDQYGRMFIGQEVTLTVDSYPDEEFTGVVTKIADEAEFTPKNIQTKEDRVTTVFRITITIDNQDLKLKAGMPADVSVDINGQ